MSKCETHMLKRILTSLKNTFKMAEISENLTEPAQKRVLTAIDETDDVVAKKQKVDIEVPPPMLGRPDRGRKVALLLAYCGAGYYGIQLQKGFPTIESELLSSLVKGKFINQEQADIPQKMHFQRAARTDKGVSCLGNIISLKMSIDAEDVVGKINENLPEQIRVLGYVRTTKGFNSKNSCDSRTYMYMVPTYALTPVHKPICDDYRIDEKTLKKLQNVLQVFKGTHNFHNYTSGVKATESCAKRYMISFEAESPVIVDGLEFITLTVKGQSFMLHHIRKMVAMAICVVKGLCTSATIEKSWTHDKMDVPKAPSEGLFLYQTHYNTYNNRYGSDGIHDPIDWSHCQADKEEFKKTYVTPHIAKSETQDRVVKNWLNLLTLHTFGTRENQQHQRVVDVPQLHPECNPEGGNEDKNKDVHQTDLINTQVSVEDRLDSETDKTNEKCSEKASENISDKASENGSENSNKNISEKS